MRRPGLRSCWRLAVVGLAMILTLGAGPSHPPRVDDWDTRPPGPVALGDTWRTYPFYERAAFTSPPAVVVDGGRAALRLSTVNESARLGRAMKIDLRETPWLVWEWKPLVLPEGGDVRDRRRNDQAARVLVVFSGMKAIAYVWDTSAPVGVEVQPDELEIFQRVLIVVRSGPLGIGRWVREKRDVYADYRRVFGEEPRQTNWIGLESHSNDTHTRSEALFGAVRFEPR